MCDGNIVYQGDAKASPAYFNQIGLKIPKRCNPADYFMKTLSINYPKQEADEEKISMLCRNYNAFLAKMISGENNTIRLEPPSQKSSEEDRRADTKVQI